ncbi:MAG: rhomboid family intramembrane serine protease GlpG [Pseudomonadota bacterium]|jgi:GlpG protein|uniref:Rhomboid family protease GlpG n=1 Tax=Alteromonas macleodii TaxID=28108 RepID=A0AB36FXB5_ALTMA|nr:rhomboid family intramembrane serine protease GlpG [Alteromonas macleodii]MCG8498708.1 rhomboid family intramembrane serine protease GlpG [Enterobacterales bacterium]MED6320450.1 rhomboid family intramembrane serine protease GlpG [Pseudomonadota bacterium]MEE3271256.1 rhomboid family intramembrane serine protease GlpG [Pseudomonadota bacterium]OES37823.1 rhomboid family protease GlpG [Alteromonas macleodii]OES37901.1 rhomboid family protease GlpG [Alteromonas macleodii]|tara:strand:- start:113 stop:976 length:864 start_codon:yes stop_codon:yes gene_type:complete
MAHPLIAFNQQSPAHLLANYLTSQHIQAAVVQHDKEFVVVLDNHDHLDRAKVIADGFLANPTDPKYQQAAWDNGKNVRLAPSGNGFSMGNIIADAVKAPFTSVVFILCVAVYLLSLFGLFAPIAQHLLMQPFSILSQNHEWWRLLGPAFIHFSALHIIFNLLWWGMLGAKIERILGMSMLLIVFLVSATISNAAQALFSDPVQGNLFLFGGLSGVVYAVMGFVWWLGWLRPSWGLSLPNSIVGFMLVWLVLGYADILWVNMANAAHTAGLISGCLLAGALSLGSGKR